MSKSHVGIGYCICPVCLKRHEEVVLLDKRMRDTLERENFVGWELCPEHARMHAEDYVALIECSEPPRGPAPEQLSRAKRTGRLAHVRRTAWPHLFDNPAPTVPLVFVEVGVIDALQAPPTTQPKE